VLFGGKKGVLSNLKNYPVDKRGHSSFVYGKIKIGKDIYVLCGTTYAIIYILK